MFLAILAAGAVATSEAAPAPATNVSPVTVTPARKTPPSPPTVEIGGTDDWTYKSPSAHILSVWPKGAFEARVDGHALLSCLVDAHGLAEDCKVVSENPGGKGFGATALLLRPTFKLKPATGPDGPAESMMTIGVQFRAADNQISMTLHDRDMSATETRMNGTPPEMREVTMLDHPVWTQAASFAELDRAYPARGGGIEGFAVAHCHVERTGELSTCEVRKEVPENRGFGDAAVRLAGRFVVRIDPTRIPKKAPLWVDIPIRFPAPDAAAAHAVSAPTWLAGIDPNRILKLFPPEAVARGLTSGRGVARCTVARDGALTQCEAAPADPDGLGFSESAVQVARVMKMNPWTADGAPVDGAVIRLPIRFNLAVKE